MGLPLKTGFPPGITLKAGYSVRFRATDPTTGADVGGVKVSGASIFVDGEGDIALVPTNVLKYVYQAEDGSQVVSGAGAAAGSGSGGGTGAGGTGTTPPPGTTPHA